MCNCHYGSVIEPKGASSFTKTTNDEVRSNRTKALKDSLAAQEASAQKGLITPTALESTGVFDSTKYGFLNESSVIDTIHPNLHEHAKLNNHMGLYLVHGKGTPVVGEEAEGDKPAIDGSCQVSVGDVLQVRGFDLANLTVVRGATGWIAMDVLTSQETAKAAFDLLRRCAYTTTLGDGKAVPVTAVVYSHSHVDHYAGVGGLISETDVKNGKCKIFAPEGFLEYAVSENVYAGNAMSTRAAFMYGTGLKREATGQVDAGLGKATSIGTKTLMPPTDTISFSKYVSGKKYQEVTVDGITMQFQLTPGTEAPAEMNVYLPVQKVLFIAENCCGTLHNLYTLRGAEVRDALTWASYLDETLATFSDVNTICSSHNWPQFSESDTNNSACINYLKKQRDVYRYLGNTALNLINKGYTIEEIGRKMETLMPTPLMDEWRNHGFYGSINHNAKAIYQKYIGWYDGNPSNLNKEYPIEAATKYVDAMGGAASVLAQAQKAYDSGEYAWAAELLNRLIFARLRESDKGTKDKAKLLNADVLEQLGYQSESAPWRNEYLTAAMVLRSEVSGQTNTPKQFELESSIIQSMTPAMLMQYMSIMFEGYTAFQKAAEPKGGVVFTDCANGEQGIFSFDVSGGVLTYLADNNATHSFEGTKKDFYNAIMGKASTAKITTDFEALRRYIKPFNQGFNIVSPYTTSKPDDQNSEKVAAYKVQKIAQGKRLQIFRAARMIEKYEKIVLGMKAVYYDTAADLSAEDKKLWNELRPQIVKLDQYPNNPVDDTLFFKASGVKLDDKWGIGSDSRFKKVEYTHFLYECYKNLYLDAPHTNLFLDECIALLEKSIDFFRGMEPTEGKQRFTGMKSDDLAKWKQTYYPILVSLNIIWDDIFCQPDPTDIKYGIGLDGKFDLTELCNVLMRCYKLAMIDELANLQIQAGTV